MTVTSCCFLRPALMRFWWRQGGGPAGFAQRTPAHGRLVCSRDLGCRRDGNQWLVNGCGPATLCAAAKEGWMLPPNVLKAQPFHRGSLGLALSNEAEHFAANHRLTAGSRMRICVGDNPVWTVWRKNLFSSSC